MHTRIDHRDEAVRAAEVRRLVHALRPFGVLHRDALKREACADSWHQGSFDSVLREAVAGGAIERLPFDFYRVPGSE